MHWGIIACKDGTRGCCKQNHQSRRDAFPCGIFEQCKGRNNTELLLEVQIFSLRLKDFHRLASLLRTYLQTTEELESAMVTLSVPFTFLEYANMEDDILTCELFTIDEIIVESLSDATRQGSGAESSNDEPEGASLTFFDTVAVLDVLRVYVSTMDCVEELKGFQIVYKSVMLKHKKRQATVSDFFKPL